MPRFLRTSRIVSAFAVLGFSLVVSCNPDRTTAPVSSEAEAESGPQLLTRIQPGDSAAVDSLAFAFSKILAQPALRKQIHEDLRDSPFGLHQIHLPSYLRGDRGRALLVALEQQGIPAARIELIVSIRGGLQLMMPRSLDRMLWKASEPLAVEGTALTVAERRGVERRLAGDATPSSAIVYGPDGVARPHSLGSVPQIATASIGPATINFGKRPEMLRASAPRNSRATLSSLEDEIQLYRGRGESLRRIGGDSAATPFDLGGGLAGVWELEQCDDPTEIYCDQGGGGDPTPPPPYVPPNMGVSIPSGMRYTDCYRPGVFDSVTDRDRDGVHDLCEYELAVAFSPQLMMDGNDCDARRFPHFAVRQAQTSVWGGVIVIFYAMSWVDDCGDAGHHGDTEFIIVEVGPSTYATYRPWSLKFATLSAHWRSYWNDQTAGYAAQDLEDAVGSPGFGPPRVWVARSKHANYRTHAVCNSNGMFVTDDCRNSYTTGLVFGPDQNLGSTNYNLVGGPYSPVVKNVISITHQETYWVKQTYVDMFHSLRLNDARFCGWLARNGDCAGSYEESLSAYRF